MGILRKTLTVSANMSGWYTFTAACDEGAIMANIKLEANVPHQFSFVSNRPGVDSAPGRRRWQKGSQTRHKFNKK